MWLPAAIAIALMTVAQARLFQGYSSSYQATQITGFNWSNLRPSSNLRWTSCHESYECARLLLPLDWSRENNANKVAVALTRVPATVDRTDQTFGGSILINPGGPGGSGTDEVLWHGHGIRDSIIDSPDKHFEIIGFDPRGVHHTSPQVSCFAHDWDRKFFQYRNWVVGQLDGEHAFNVKNATFASLAKLCSVSATGRFDDGTNMHQFVSSALTARDMIGIVDALQEETIGEMTNSLGNQHKQQVLLAMSKPALVNYWGFSYGTYLGNTFASMFPDRVGRMILDGNVDPVDYSATGWLSNLFDHNKNVHWFYYACFNAKERCRFFDADTSSLFDLENKMLRLLKRLKDNPLPVVHEGAADLVTYSDLTNLIHSASYAPLFYWESVAQVAHDLTNDNGTSIVKYLKNLQLPQSANPTDPDSVHHNASLRLDNATLPYPPDYSGGLEAAISILCGDGEPITSLTKHDWQLRLSHLKNQSSIAGPLWADIPFACSSWPSNLRPAEHNRFIGPFTSKLADYDKRASPILFIGNTADPVTPLRNAVENSKHHEGSVVLTQDGPGHCAGPVNPSACTYEVIRSFFANGTLPEKDKVCMIDRSPWEETSDRHKTDDAKQS